MNEAYSDDSDVRMYNSLLRCLEALRDNVQFKKIFRHCKKIREKKGSRYFE